MCFKKVLHAQNAEHYVMSHFMLRNVTFKCFDFWHYMLGRTGLQNFFSKKDMPNMRQKCECFNIFSILLMPEVQCVT